MEDRWNAIKAHSEQFLEKTKSFQKSMISRAHAPVKEMCLGQVTLLSGPNQSQLMYKSHKAITVRAKTK